MSNGLFMQPSFGEPVGQGRYTTYPDPFQDIASSNAPENVITMLRYCEHIVSKFGPYRQALQRVIAYFITNVNVSGVSDEEKKDYEEYLQDKLHLLLFIHNASLDFLTYGVSYTSVLPGFRRYLVCPQNNCHFRAPLKEIMRPNSGYQFTWSDFRFHAHCPKCHYRGDWGKPDDVPMGAEGVFLKRWDPHFMDLIWMPYQNKNEYVWKIPADYRTLVNGAQEAPEILEDAPWDVLCAMRTNQWLKLTPGVVHGWREEYLSGVRARGWGIPRTFSNFPRPTTRGADERPRTQ